MFRMGIDVGGTSISAGITAEDGRLICKNTVQSQVALGREAICRNIRQAADSVLNMSGARMDEILSIGMGFPGSADTDSLTVYSSGNMHCTDGINMRDIFYDIPEKTRLFLDNDANAAAWGEYIYRQTKDKDLTMVTVGTGVGCGIIINGRIYRGFNGLAGEVGHMVIERDGRPCGCGRRGCLERYASVSGLIMTARQIMDIKPKGELHALCGGDYEKLDGRMIFKAYSDGDIVAKQAVLSFIEYLAEGISNVIMLIQPKLIVLSGAVMQQGDVILQPLREICNKNMYGTENGYTGIEIAKCADAGIIGAAMLGACLQNS